MPPVFPKIASPLRVAGGALGILSGLVQLGTNVVLSSVAVLFADTGIVPTRKIAFAFLLTFFMLIAAVAALKRPTIGGLAMIVIGTYCLFEPYLLETPRGNPAVIGVIAGFISIASGMADWLINAGIRPR
jgi:hypothetical protein